MLTPARLLFLGCVLLGTSSLGRRTARTSRTSRTSTRPKAPGPNMCMVQKVYGSGEKFFTHCVARHLRMICERPTYSSWDCCSGFERENGYQGCTKEKPLENLVATVEQLGLKHFRQHVTKSNLTDLLTHQGAFTVFAPSDLAFRATNPQERSLLDPGDGSDSLLMYHVALGRLPFSAFRARNQKFDTLYRDEKIRVNKYAYGVATVNCARILQPDVKATNGIVHVIDKVVKPADVAGDLADLVFSDDRYSQFQLALLVADLVNQLRQTDSGLTLLAPTDQAFARLPSDLLDRILTDPMTAQKVIERHVVKGVFCGDAIVLSVGLKTRDGGRLMFRCTKRGLRVNNANVVDPDQVATNGVLHGIDKVILPDSVRQPTDLLDEMHANKFMALTRRAGLEHRLTNLTNATIFAPTDRAFNELPSGTRAALTKDPQAVSRLLDYHIAQGQLTQDTLIGDMKLNTAIGISAAIKVSVFREGVAVDTAKTVGPLRQCDKAAVQKVSKVLIPSHKTLMDLINDDRELSMFRQAVETSGVSEMLLQDGRYTVLAPTDRAFSYLTQWRLDHMMNSPRRLRAFVERHVVKRMITKCEVPKASTYGLRSLQGDFTVFNYDTRGTLLINDLINVKQADQLATNGVLHKIHDTLQCTCERGLTSSSTYRHRTRRRKRHHKLRH